MIRRLIIAVGALAAVVFAMPALAQAYPYTTTSYYVDTHNTTTLYTWGCNAGTAGANGAVILDFGRPAYSNGTYGTIDFEGTNGVFISNATIASLIDNYARGYYNCSPPGVSLTIALGTNNYDCPSSPGGCTSDAVPNFTTAGSNWGTRTNDLGNYIYTQGYSSQEYAAASDDAEPAWNPGFTETGDLLSGYWSTANWILYDDGSLDPGYWSPPNLHEWDVAYGGLDFPFPQVYQQSMADEWESLDLWGVSNEGYAMLFEGVLSTTIGFTPHQAYDAMVNDLNSHASTSQSSIANLSKIQYG